MDGELEQLMDWVRNRYFGKYRGTVTDNNDSTNRGRLKVMVPSVLGILDIWAMPCLPYAGDGVGVYTIPEAGAGVWVEFEAGDPSFPVWTGGYWANNELPKDNQGTPATPSLRILRSESGLMVAMDDKGKKITVSDENGDNFLSIESQQGKIKVKGNTKIVIEAPAIELVENATQPLVLGNELMSFLNQLVQNLLSHTHPHPMGPTGPPIPPLQPPTPAILSTKVKTG